MQIFTIALYLGLPLLTIGLIGLLLIKKQIKTQMTTLLTTLHENQVTASQQLQAQLSQHQADQMQRSHENHLTGINTLQTQLQNALKHHSDIMSKHMGQLTQSIEGRLGGITQQLNQRLREGFEQSSVTFNQVIKRLTIIDEAQKKITALSDQMVSLQSILSDKHRRGTFGETQLSALISNCIPETHYSLQHTLSNGKRPDCVLFLPPPTGNIAIDAKFPLEYYHAMHDSTDEPPSPQSKQAFKKGIQKHIDDISSKYILTDETADGAIMFIPAESIFAEIHAKFPEIVTYAQQKRVWITSPTTLMAILNTARAVIKDAATREHIHTIQTHLRYLAEDFGRFEKRMDRLSRHIHQAHTDVEDVHRSAQKIVSRFNHIERVEVAESSAPEN